MAGWPPLATPLMLPIVFQRSIPIRKALDCSTLLAYEMNGRPLPVEHGFPLRAVVPGWAGDSRTKWVTSVRVLDTEHDGFWMARAGPVTAVDVSVDGSNGSRAQGGNARSRRCIGWGARVGDADRARLLDYLAGWFGP